MMKKVTFLPLIKDTYLAVVKNSVGSKMWRNFYARVGKDKKDIMGDGDLSCAFYVSSILTLFGLIEKIHGTVAGTIHDLEKSGWKKINPSTSFDKARDKSLRMKKSTAGAVLVWAEKCTKGECHAHIGFCLDDQTAVSNSSKSGQIAKHHLTYGTKNGQPVRPIVAVYSRKF